jgi:hypothetical protein
MASGIALQVHFVPSKQLLLFCSLTWVFLQDSEVGGLCVDVSNGSAILVSYPRINSLALCTIFPTAMKPSAKLSCISMLRCKWTIEEHGCEHFVGSLKIFIDSLLAVDTASEPPLPSIRNNSAIVIVIMLATRIIYV